MPNFGTVLKEEIKRLAARVSRKADAPLKKDVVYLKHQVSELKKVVVQLRRDNAQLLSDLKGRLAAPPAADKAALEGARLSPRLIHAQRKRLGLSREAFAKLVGVSAGAVMTWEGGRSKPREEARAALVAIRQLGKRDARWRLEALNSNGNAHHAAPRHTKRSPRRRRTVSR